ncbi:MAG: hypothetical protein FJX29_11840 [Alphaproteobacteria bacterium]|nr:hypothetical protein [Alphaproteobacteria bacterium]
MRRLILFVAAASCAILAGGAPAFARNESCEAFKAYLQKNLADLAPQFVRPVVVTRGAGPASDIYDLVTSKRIDGQLSCDGDRFIRFEARISLPAGPDLRDGFYRVQETAIRAKFSWPAARAARFVHGMTGEVADYLRASGQRGDFSVAGKVERHEGQAGDAGLIWTNSDRTFILVAYTP